MTNPSTYTASHGINANARPYPTVLDLEKRIAALEREARQHWHLMPSPPDGTGMPTSLAVTVDQMQAPVPCITDASLPNECDPAMIAMHNAIAAKAARNALAAIRAGKVPGIRALDDNAMTILHDAREQRDAARARVAELEGLLREVDDDANAYNNHHAGLSPDEHRDLLRRIHAALAAGKGMPNPSDHRTAKPAPLHRVVGCEPLNGENK